MKKPGLFLATLLLALSIFACGSSEQSIQTAIAETQASWTSTPLPASTVAPLAPDTPTVEAIPAGDAMTATVTASCYRWDQVTASMNGQKICVRGVIYSFSKPGNAGTRYAFSAEPNHFFLYSGRWEFYDPITGKTLAAGRCVQATAKIRLQGEVPYINLDDIAGETSGQTVNDFQFFDDPSSCK